MMAITRPMPAAKRSGNRFRQRLKRSGEASVSEAISKRANNPPNAPQVRATNRPGNKADQLKGAALITPK